MITLITGAPGSGKTLYCVSKLIPPLVGAKVTRHNDDGTEEEIERRLCTNIDHLLLPHELIGEEGDQGIMKWHEWCKAGDVIVYDEIQKPWPNRPAGSKVPDCIQQLEVHRHKGVDLILMTQSPMLIDRNVRQLVGRHLHIRRIANLHAAIVYEWDLCSNGLRYRDAITRSAWRYSKKVFKQYHSADLHTKQPRRLPSHLWWIMGALAGMAMIGPRAYDRIHQRAVDSGFAEGKTSQELLASNQQKKPGQWPTTGQAGQGAHQVAATVPSVPQPVVPPAPQIMGCISMGDRCECIGSDAHLATVELKQCIASSKRSGLLVPYPTAVAQAQALPVSQPAQQSHDQVQGGVPSADAIKPLTVGEAHKYGDTRVAGREVFSAPQ